MKSTWELKHTNSINQMLRLRENIEINKEEFPALLVVKHQYHIADDIMFPDPACLAFFTSFEENHLKGFEEDGTLCLVAVDIFEGLIQFYIYCKDARQSVHDCIAYLKSNPNYTVEFEIINDAFWQRYDALHNLSK